MKNIQVEDVEVIDLSNNKKSVGKSNGKKPKNCKSCKSPGLKFGHWISVIIGFYIVFASIYGTIQLIKSIF
jgi:hypothetical protein